MSRQRTSLEAISDLTKSKVEAAICKLVEVEKEFFVDEREIAASLDDAGNPNKGRDANADALAAHKTAKATVVNFIVFV